MAMSTKASEDQMPEIDVSAGVIFCSGKLLITQRPEGTHLEGLWEFPGGKRLTNESWENCLHRELREELGIEVEIVGLMHSIQHAYPEKLVTLKFFKCLWKANEPQAIECADYAWTTLDELNNYQFPAADEALLASLSKEWIH